MTNVIVSIPSYLNFSQKKFPLVPLSESIENTSDNLTNESHEHQCINDIDSKVNDNLPEKRRSFSVQCGICKNTFANISNLKRHLKRIHSINPKIVKIKNFVCQLCNRQFSYQQQCILHLQKTHPDAIAASKHPLILASTGDLKYSCSKCNQRFSSRYYLRCHQLEEHKPVSTAVKLVCPLCHELFLRKDILIHFETTHDIKLETTQIEFPSICAFLAWKENMEIETKSKFIKQTEVRMLANRHYYLRCNRSGNFQSRGQGKRNLKAKGSNKINGYCPASIKVKEMKDGRCIATYLKSHVGHEADLGHLPLSYSERQYLASKIAAKVPFNEILDEVHNSVPESGLQRLHLITRKDLHNIRSSFFRFKSSGKRKNNSTTVEAFVKKMENEHLCVLPKDLRELPKKRIDSNRNSSVLSPVLNKSNEDLHVLSESQKDSNISLFVLPKILNESYKDSPVLPNKDMHVFPEEPNDSNEDSCMLIEGPNADSHALAEKLTESNKDTGIIVEQLEDKRSISLSFNERKEALKKKYLELINSVSTSVELDILESSFISLKKIIDSKYKSDINFRSILLQNKIIPQTLIFSHKKL